MNVRTLITASALTILTMGSSFAQDTTPIYGSQLMTRQERIEYRNQMRALKTQEERNAFRLEHHNRMQERAKERGLKLPDAPPAQGGGKGRRMGPGMGGMGPGMGGMGPGMGGMGGMGPGMGGMGGGRP